MRVDEGWMASGFASAGAASLQQTEWAIRAIAVWHARGQLQERSACLYQCRFQLIGSDAHSIHSGIMVSSSIFCFHVGSLLLSHKC